MFNPTRAVCKQHYKELFHFSISPKQSPYHGSEDKKEQVTSWAAARSNLVGNPASSWHVTVAKGGETKACLPNFSCAIRSRKRLVQSNSTLNTLFPSDSHLMVLTTRGYVQGIFFSENLPKWVQNAVLASLAALSMWLPNPPHMKTYSQLSCRYCSLLSKPHPKTLFITRWEGPHLQTVSWQQKS